MCIQALKDLFSPRKKEVKYVCPDTNLLPSNFCTTPIPMRYYTEPRDNEPTIPVEICQLHRPPVEYVKKDICLISQKVSNLTCRKTELREYVKGTEPTVSCSTDHTPVPPPPPWPEKCKYQYWMFIPELMWAFGDRRKFLKTSRMGGAWGVRCFSVQSWSKLRNEYPWLQMEHNGQKVILDNPKEGWNAKVCDMGYDMAYQNYFHLNPVYWAELNKLLDELEEFDLGITLSIGDNCSMRNSDAAGRGTKNEYPFMDSRQTCSPEFEKLVVPKDAWKKFEYSPGGYHSTYRYRYHQRWIQELIDTLKKHPAVPYWIEVENEFSIFTWKPGDKPPINWYAMMVKAIMDNGVPRNRIVHSGIKGTIDIIKPHLGIYSQHAIVRPDPALKDITPEMRPMTLISTDGGGNGNSTVDIDCKGRRGISLTDAVTLANEKIKKLHLLGFEYMPRLAYAKSDLTGNLDLINYDVMNVMIKELNK
jgi:hypothetical protein